MIRTKDTTCPECKGFLKYYDKVSRIIKTKGGEKKKLKIRRFRCVSCRKLHRELPNYIYPYKQYDANIIEGVLNGYISPDTIGYEDYPCEITMFRWARGLQSIL